MSLPAACPCLPALMTPGTGQGRCAASGMPVSNSHTCVGPSAKRLLASLSARGTAL